MGLPTQPIPNSATKRAPYGMLKVSMILMTIAVACGVMVIASATQLGTDFLKKIGGLLFLATIGTGYWAKSETPLVCFESVRCERFQTMCVAVLLLAGEEGIRVGTDVRHVKKIVALTEQLNSLAPKSAQAKQQFVQIARQATPTMAEYIQRYGKLEMVLNDYESSLRDSDRVGPSLGGTSAA